MRRGRWSGYSPMVGPVPSELLGDVEMDLSWEGEENV